jgi:tRNA G18 (ribose-2'-O)-methylase SpoU
VRALRQLRRFGIAGIAAHPRADRFPLSGSNLRGDCCLVFGSEGYGLSQDVLDACDRAVAIPMANEVDSLNIGNACAVFLYEVNRQRSET